MSILITQKVLEQMKNNVDFAPKMNKIYEEIKNLANSIPQESAYISISLLRIINGTHVHLSAVGHNIEFDLPQQVDTDYFLSYDKYENILDVEVY
jgi:hypoxanthine-guanine phosphoribosyltransferase